MHYAQFTVCVSKYSGNRLRLLMLIPYILFTKGNICDFSEYIKSEILGNVEFRKLYRIIMFCFRFLFLKFRIQTIETFYI